MRTIRPGSLARNVGIYFGTGVLTQGLVFLLWLVLARWMPAADIGLYGLGTFVADLAAAVGVMGTDATLTRFYHSDRDPAQVLSTCLLVLFAGLLTVVGLLRVSTGWIEQVSPGVGTLLRGHFVLLCALAAANSVATLLLVHYTALRESGVYSRLMLVRTLVFAGVGVAAAALHAGAVGLYVAAIAGALTVVVHTAVAERDLWTQARVDTDTAAEVLGYGLPLMLYAVLGVAATYAGRLLLDHYGDLTTLGVYTVFLTITLQLNGLWSSFNRAWTPEAFARLNDDREAMVRRITQMAALASLLYLVLMVGVVVACQSFLLRLLFTPDYAQRGQLLYILLLAPLFTGIYTMAYPLYYYRERTTRVLAVSGMLAAINLVVSVVAIRAFGDLGAALAFVAITMLTPVLYFAAFRTPMAIPFSIIRGALVLTALLGAGATLMVVTGSVIPLLLALVAGIVSSYGDADLPAARDVVRRQLVTR